MVMQYDAWRVGANIAMDWAWWGRDAWQRAHADTLQNFFMTKGQSAYMRQNSSLVGLKQVAPVEMNRCSLLPHHECLYWS